jgi:hypothetical protein
MLAWARTKNETPVFPVLLGQTLGGSSVPSGVAGELVQMMAGLILSKGKETCYA